MWAVLLVVLARGVGAIFGGEHDRPGGVSGRPAEGFPDVEARDRLLDQDPSLDVRRLTGTSDERIRVGDWRVRFDRDITAHEIVILRVLPRGRAYDR